MFVDEAKIYVKAGGGGDGCNSLYKDKWDRYGRPDGGVGGKGGDVIFEVSLHVQTLLDFHYRQHFESDRGSHGSSNHKKGRSGQDLNVPVPAGTIVKDASTGLVIRELLKPGERVVIARGGPGGKGNSRGRESESGHPGEEKTVLLELKLIADVGIIGHPNAGKSTLISRISYAHPKIASYPFTTKGPVLGVVKIADDASFVAAEIPGIIEGAHEGRGLGDKFLRHVERTKVLIHIIDAAATEGRDPYKDYVMLNKELKLYSKELAKKTQVIALNKADVPEAAGHIKAFKRRCKRPGVFPISAVTGEGVKELMRAVYKHVEKLKKQPQ